MLDAFLARDGERLTAVSAAHHRHLEESIAALPPGSAVFAWSDPRAARRAALGSATSRRVPESTRVRRVSRWLQRWSPAIAPLTLDEFNSADPDTATRACWAPAWTSSGGYPRSHPAGRMPIESRCRTRLPPALTTSPGPRWPVRCSVTRGSVRRHRANRAMRRSRPPSSREWPTRMRPNSQRGTWRTKQRFGYIYLICASGLTGEQMLAALRERLTHDDEQERDSGHARVTEDRVVATGEGGGGMTSAPAAIGRLSTHVLDTTLGRPAAGIPAVLEHIAPDGSSSEVGHGTTDSDGRINQLNSLNLTPGEYRLVLVTGGYFNDNQAAVFYPADHRAVPAVRRPGALPHRRAGEHLLVLHLPRQLISAHWDRPARRPRDVRVDNRRPARGCRLGETRPTHCFVNMWPNADDGVIEMTT